jgi:hypothetical protein
MLYPNGGWIFRQDNDPKHISEYDKDYIKRKKWNALRWSAPSPDLNPIENLWSKLDELTEARRSQTEAQLFEMLKTAWQNLDMHYLQNLVCSMTRRMATVLENEGAMMDG